MVLLVFDQLTLERGEKGREEQLDASNHLTHLFLQHQTLVLFFQVGVAIKSEKCWEGRGTSGRGCLGFAWEKGEQKEEQASVPGSHPKTLRAHTSPVAPRAFAPPPDHHRGHKKRFSWLVSLHTLCILHMLAKTGN